MSSSVNDMMAKAVTTSTDFYQTSNAVQGYKDRKDAIRKERRERKNTLSQWYGMKKAELSEHDKKELELLQYRNFINPDLKHMAPKKTASTVASDFVEFGFVAGTGRNKRRRYRSFADEWVEENPEFEEVVAQRMKQNVKLTKKAKALAAKRASREAARAKRKTSQRKSKRDIF